MNRSFDIRYHIFLRKMSLPRYTSDALPRMARAGPANPLRGDVTGFTLLEVMVAIAILGIGLLVIIQLFSEGLRSVSSSDNYTMAAMYAKERMTETLTLPELTTGITQGTSDDNKFKWRVGVAPHPTDALGNNLPFSAYKVKVDVTWPGRLTEKGVILETLKTVVSKQ